MLMFYPKAWPSSTQMRPLEAQFSLGGRRRFTLGAWKGLRNNGLLPFHVSFLSLLLLRGEVYQY